ncbi:MAG: ABC transporter permease [Clostridium sp.]
MKSYKGLVGRYIKNERRSVVPIFLSIILTISLITSVVFITQNTIRNSLDAKKLLFGDYDIRLQKINSDRLDKIKNNENVKDYALGKNNEVIVNKVQGTTPEDTFLSYSSVYAVEKKFFDEYINFNVIEGRLPENNNEIILNKKVLSTFPGKPGVGSKIDVSLRQLNGLDTYIETARSTLWGVDLSNTYDVESIDKQVQERINKDIKVEDDKKTSYKIVGIIETDIGDTLFGNKVIRLLSDEEMANTNNEFEAFTYLKDPSKQEEIVKDLGLKYILPNSSMTDPFGYPAADVKYPGYDKDSYTSIINNKLSRTILGIIILFCFTAVYNTFHTSVAKRIKVYGILRAIGGNMNQIGYLIYSEALLLFVVAAPIGLSLGYLITKLESYVLINSVGLLQRFSIDFNLEVILITLISVFLIVFIAVKSVLRKEGKLTPIEAIMDARGLTRNKKSLGSNILGQSLSESTDGNEDKDAIKELLDYDKTTLKFRIMKSLFKFEGELAHKNITRDAKPHKLTKSTLFIAMAMLIFFFLQVVNGTINGKNLIKSDKWDVELSLEQKQFDNKVIDEITKVNGVENVYRVSDAKIPLVVSNDKLSQELQNVLKERSFQKDDDASFGRGISAQIMTIDENSIKLYNNIDKEALDNGGVVIINKATNYVEKRSMEGGGQIDYMFINSDPTLNYGKGDSLSIAEDDTVLTAKGIKEYKNDSRKLKEVKVVGNVDDDLLYSTFKSTNISELDCYVKLLTTEKGLNKILGKPANNKILIKTTNDYTRANTISEINKIVANNNYSMRDTIGMKLQLERNVKESLGLNIIFAITVIIMVVLNLVNTANASILARRKELAGMRAIGMSNSQEKRMIIGELFYVSLTVAFTVILSVGVLSFANQSVNIGLGKVSVWVILLGEAAIIASLMIISNLTALGPLAQAKKFSIVEDLKEE